MNSNLPHANMIEVIDDDGAGTVYVATAWSGSANNEAVWAIKLKVTNGQDTTIKWADGNTLHDKVWDDRATYTYS